MGRVTEAIHMINCSPKEWQRYSRKINGEYFYNFLCDRETLQRLRNKYRVRNNN